MAIITCLLIEPNDLIRAGVQSLLNEQGLEVKQESSYSSLSSEFASVYIVGFGTETAISAYSALEAIQNKEKKQRILCISAAASPEEWRALSRLGVLGYCSREVTKDLLILGVQLIDKGATFVCPRISNIDSAGFKIDDEGLSRRELEVLTKVAKGFSNQEIADTLGISIETVKAHVKNILSKLSVTDRTQAAVKAIKNGLITN